MNSKKIISILLTGLLVIGFLTFTPVRGAVKLTVSYINVGEGLSVLVQLPNGKTLLYDAGPQKAVSTVISYLKSKKITKIDALVLSCLDSDHIGGADEVIKTFAIGSIYMPKVVQNTQSYLDVLNAVKAKGLTIKTAQKGVTISLDPSVKIAMWSPLKAYSTDDINDWSAVTSVVYGSTSFLFSGDAETKAENDMLSAGVVKPQTVFQVGHHGSKYSTSTAFLNAIEPKYAVISVGTNSYGHPTPETISRLQSAKAQILRTDKQGTIVAYSDGKTVTWNVKPWVVTVTKPAPSTPAKSTVKVQIVSKDLAGEKVVIKNNGTTDVDMSGWKLISVQGNQTFTFPQGFILRKGASVTVVSGKNAYNNPPSVLMWKKANMWNNDKDPAKLLNSSGVLVSSVP
ncbi:MBL fold metallo-hydrolase [Coprothermobacter platensis]|uniref:MBL fold metallo-hydrolase n=1 Tax=Coprothermobacter platensis TaxID=108819 RepID=UPI00035DD4CD|nr:MBL fold metallo-hydrolase [Coprothermobacter platensis]